MFGMVYLSYIPCAFLSLGFKRFIYAEHEAFGILVSVSSRFWNSETPKATDPKTLMLSYLKFPKCFESRNANLCHFVLLRTRDTAFPRFYD